MSAVDAITQGRQRKLLSQAQQLSAKIKALPLDTEFEDTTQLLYHFAESVEKMSSVAQADASQSIWAQRTQWMLEELISHLSERLQLVAADRFWQSVVLLLFSAARSCREQTEAMQAQCREQEAKIADLQDKLKEMETLDQSQGRQAESAVDEVMELRTRMVMAQREVQQRTAESREAVTAAQRSAAQCQALRDELASLQRDAQQHRTESERQAKVVTHLMSKNQEYTAQSASLSAANEELLAHNKVLSVNLENSARVIEKLIDLNEEAMNRFNAISMAAEKQSATKRQHTGQTVDRDTAEIDLARSPNNVSLSSASTSGKGIAAPVKGGGEALSAQAPSKGLGDALALYLEHDMASPASAATLANPSGISVQQASLASGSARPGIGQWLGGFFGGGRRTHDPGPDDEAVATSVVMDIGDDDAAQNI